MLENLDYLCFHCPYSKLVQKSFGRLLYNDLITCPDSLQKQIGKENFLLVDQYRNMSSQQSLTDKNLEKVFVKGAVITYSERVCLSLILKFNLKCNTKQSPGDINDQPQAALAL